MVRELRAQAAVQKVEGCPRLVCLRTRAPNDRHLAQPVPALVIPQHFQQHRGWLEHHSAGRAHVPADSQRKPTIMRAHVEQDASGREMVHDPAKNVARSREFPSSAGADASRKLSVDPSGHRDRWVSAKLPAGQVALQECMGGG